MDILTNPLIGYREVQYFYLLRNMGEENQDYFSRNVVKETPNKINKNFSNNYPIINYQKKGCINSCSKLSQKGLEMRAKIQEQRAIIESKKFVGKVKKIKIPKWTFMNENLFNLKNNRLYKNQNT